MMEFSEVIKTSHLENDRKILINLTSNMSTDMKKLYCWVNPNLEIFHELIFKHYKSNGLYISKVNIRKLLTVSTVWFSRGLYLSHSIFQFFWTSFINKSFEFGYWIEITLIELIVIDVELYGVPLLFSFTSLRRTHYYSVQNIDRILFYFYFIITNYKHLY